MVYTRSAAVSLLPVVYNIYHVSCFLRIEVAVLAAHHTADSHIPNYTPQLALGSS